MTSISKYQYQYHNCDTVSIKEVNSDKIIKELSKQHTVQVAKMKPRRFFGMHGNKINRYLPAARQQHWEMTTKNIIRWRPPCFPPLDTYTH